MPPNSKLKWKLFRDIAPMSCYPSRSCFPSLLVASLGLAIPHCLLPLVVLPSLAAHCLSWSCCPSLLITHATVIFLPLPSLFAVIIWIFWTCTNSHPAKAHELGPYITQLIDCSRGCCMIWLGCLDFDVLSLDIKCCWLMMSGCQVSCHIFSLWSTWIYANDIENIFHNIFQIGCSYSLSITLMKTQ